jgi:hypothetical protein
MPRTHIVRPGDYVALIAARFGLHDAAVILEAPENARLRRGDRSPDLLAPGDRVVIPDPAPRSERADTGQRHRFVTTAPPPPKLRVRPRDNEGRPLALDGAEARVGGQPRPTSVDDEVVTVEIQFGDEHVELDLPMARVKLRLAVGHLDPLYRDRDASEVMFSGVQARLQNLGYLTGAATGIFDKATTRALRAFQRAAMARSAPDGHADEETLAALEEHHGS